MANQIALQLVVPPGDELLGDADAHVVTYEMGAAAAIGGISTRTWPSVGAALDADADRRDDPAGRLPVVPTRAIAVEQTHNRGGGGGHRRWPPCAACAALADDGRRGRCTATAPGSGTRTSPTACRWSTYGALFDTLSVCLSKGLGAPVGSLVVGSAERIARAR